MNTIEILSKLESVNFTTEQARTITEIIEDRQHALATKDDVKIIVASEVSKAKYDLVKWIVGGLIANGLVNALLKYFG